MWFATDDEVLKWFEETKWHHGLRVVGTQPYYSDPATNCLELKFPETPLRVTFFTRVIAMLGLEDESLFYGALLWVTQSQIGSPQLEKSGWKLIERMRAGYGENRSLQTTSGHFFRDDELDLSAFLIPCFVYSWDAYVVPNANNDFFVHISHNEYWGVVARTIEAYDRLFSELKGLGPQESPKMRERFCRPGAM